MRTPFVNAKNITIITLVLGSFLSSCKAKKAVVAGEVNSALATKKIIQNHYANALDFETMSGKVKIDYQSVETNQGVTVSLRMKKDEVIWLSAPLSLFKVYITPEGVSFYNKLEKEYFDGDFSYISNLLGYEMDFVKVQNVLLGNTVLDLRETKYNSDIENEAYVLKPRKQNDLFKILFALEPQYFRTKQQQISQPEENRFLKLDYGYQDVASKVVPNQVNIEAINKDEVLRLDLDYRNIEFDKTINFPYKIPKGFKPLVLK